MILDIEIVTPTLNRPERLARMQASLAAQGVDARNTVSHETVPRSLPAAYNDLLRAATGDVVVLAQDDLEFLPGCLRAVLDAFAEHFPDLDGVVGLNLTNQPAIPNCTEFAVVAVGRRFLDRFPGRVVCCPEYWHFSYDVELGLCARTLGRFHWAEAARVFHHHPSFSKDPADETHRASRLRKQQDATVRAKRRAKGWLWGLTFDRVAPASDEPHAAPVVTRHRYFNRRAAA